MLQIYNTRLISHIFKILSALFASDHTKIRERA